MLPLVYSWKEAERVGNGWHRDGENVCYYQNTSKKKKDGQSNAFCLSFDLQFWYDLDEIYVAHCYPYTYSDLWTFVNSVCTTNNRDWIRKTSMCKTLAGNDCEMLIITNFYSWEEDIAERSAIIITARVHPGESNSSFIMEGILEFLVSNDPNA